MDRLTSKHHTVIELLAKGFSNRQCGDAVGLAESTIKGYRNSPLFRNALAEAINLKAESSNYKLHGLFRSALEEVEGLLQDRNPHIRLGAARLACESYAAIVRAAEEKDLLLRMEERMEQLQANMSTAAPILEAEDAEFHSLPPAGLDNVLEEIRTADFASDSASSQPNSEQTD